MNAIFWARALEARSLCDRSDAVGRDLKHWAGARDRALYVRSDFRTPNASRLTLHASCLKPQASRLTPHRRTSRLAPHASRLTRQASQLVLHDSSFTSNESPMHSFVRRMPTPTSPIHPRTTNSPNLCLPHSLTRWPGPGRFHNQRIPKMFHMPNALATKACFQLILSTESCTLVIKFVLTKDNDHCNVAGVVPRGLSNKNMCVFM